MFLSYAVVPVFALTILLNFFCLYSPIDSLQAPEKYPKCEDCLASPCHKEKNGTCGLNNDNCTYICFTCTSPLYAIKEDCEKKCSDDSKSCVCDGQCFSCIDNSDQGSLNCSLPEFVVDNKCVVTAYGPPSGTYADPNGDTKAAPQS